jgi:hypothetical protein
MIDMAGHGEVSIVRNQTFPWVFQHAVVQILRTVTPKLKQRIQYLTGAPEIQIESDAIIYRSHNLNTRGKRFYNGIPKLLYFQCKPGRKPFVTGNDDTTRGSENAHGVLSESEFTRLKDLHNIKSC